MKQPRAQKLCETEPWLVSNDEREMHNSQPNPDREIEVGMNSYS